MQLGGLLPRRRRTRSTRPMILKTIRVNVDQWGRMILIPHLLLYLLLPVLAGNSFFLCISGDDHVALEFGSDGACCPPSQCDTSEEFANNTCSDRHCHSCIDFQLTDSTSKATPSRFESLIAPGEEDGRPSLPSLHTPEQVFVASRLLHPEVPPPVPAHSTLSTVVLLI